jgi:hypothetical protein
LPLPLEVGVIGVEPLQPPVMKMPEEDVLPRRPHG